MKTLVLFLAVVLFINCNKNELGACLEESSVKETSIYGTWLLKGVFLGSETSADAGIDTCYDSNGSIVTFTASNTFSWDRINGDTLIHLCSQDTFSGTFELSKDAEYNYIELSYKCEDKDKLRVIKHKYSFRNQYLLISTGCEGGCSSRYVRQS